MSSPEESPAQRQARLRRERREAKIKAGGADRLNRITGLSGRSPDVVRAESPSPAASPIATPGSSTPSTTQTPPSRPQQQPSSVPFPEMADQTPAQRQAQEEYLRALLRAPQAPSEQSSQQPGQASSVPEDPMLRLMQSMLGGAGGGIPGLDPSAFGGMGGASGPGTPGAGPGQQPEMEMPDLSSTLAQATGLPPFLTDMFFGTKPPPPTPAAAKRMQQLKLVHAVFALFVGIYLLLTYTRSVAMFGTNPPPPATARNPLLWFFTGEALIEGLNAVVGNGDAAANGNGRGGSLAVVKKGMATARQVCADGGVVLFIIGAGMWFMG